MNFAEYFRHQQGEHKWLELAVREMNAREHLERIEFIAEVLRDGDYRALAVLNSKPLHPLLSNALIRLRGQPELIQQRYYQNLSQIHFARFSEATFRVGVVTADYGSIVCELDKVGFLERVWSGASGWVTGEIEGTTGTSTVLYPTFDATPFLLPEARLEENQRHFDRALDAAFARAAKDGVVIPESSTPNPVILTWLKSNPTGTTIGVIGESADNTPDIL